jgi:hypothetical protein
MEGIAKIPYLEKIIAKVSILSLIHIDRADGESLRSLQDAVEDPITTVRSVHTALHRTVWTQ